MKKQTYGEWALVNKKTGELYKGTDCGEGYDIPVTMSSRAEARQEREMFADEPELWTTAKVNVTYQLVEKAR